MINRLLGQTPNASEHGFMIDHMLEFAHWFMAILFVGWSIFFLYTIFRFRKGSHPKADYYGVRTKASTHIEFMVVLVDVLLLLGFALPLWTRRVADFPSKDAYTIRVIAQQFSWNFHYAGADGVFGRQDVSFISSANSLGIDPKDPAGKDDIVTRNELHLPQDRNVILRITSKDVIHNLSLQSMRMSQDAIPGTEVPVWFKPVRASDPDHPFEIICGQLCGLGHYNMRATMIVEPVADFNKFLEDQAKLTGAGGTTPAAPSTSGGAPANPPPPDALQTEPNLKVPSVPVPSEQPPGATLQAMPNPGGTPASGTFKEEHK
jgi:cytochrome c oxidase subunit 2